MRNAALAAIAVVIIVAVVLGLRSSSPRGSLVATATPSLSTPSPSATATSIASAVPTPAGEAGEVTVQAIRTTVPAEFKYLILGGGDEFHLIVLDLNKGTASPVATARVARPPGTQGQPAADVSASVDGRSVLLTFVLPEAPDSLFTIRPELGEARKLLGGEIRGAVLSADGTRIAVGRKDDDPSITGLWTGPLSNGSMRRLIADDPQFNASPPLPYAFSADDRLLLFGLGLGETGWRAMLAQVDSAEARIERSGAEPRIVGGSTTPLGPVFGPGQGADFRSADQVFVWSSRGVFGGETVTYLYDLAARRVTELYRPGGETLIIAAALRPNTDEYATIERPLCCGAFVPGTAAFIRGRDGSARRLGDAVFVGEIWWSKDGSRLFAEVGGDDSVGGITDLLTGNGVMQFCKRGGGPPPAPCT